MKIILSQRIDIESEYDDVPFSTYHYPKRYRNQINTGDRFIYYQGNRHKKEYRYYFGCGVIGAIEPDATKEHFFAEILDGHRFSPVVPIYNPEGDGYIESIGYAQIRKSLNPPWQNSIRKISDDAFSKILELANIDNNVGLNTSKLESEVDPLETLHLLNNQYENILPTVREKKVQTHLDRGSNVTKALKLLLGAKCQICGWIGFEKNDGDDFIEAHHIIPVSERRAGSLCTENIVLLCPNCHREVHYGKNFSVNEDSENIIINLSSKKAIIRKNTMEYLSQLKD